MPLKRRTDTNETASLPREERRATTRESEDLQEILKSGDEDERRWAARDLAAFPDAAIPLCRFLETEQSIPVREAILTSLLTIGSESTADGLLPLLRSEDAHLRNAAIEALQHLPGPVATRIERLLTDADTDVRLFAIDILGTLPHSSVPGWLLNVIERDADANVCGSALNVLAEVGTPDMVPAIESVAARFPDEPYIRFAADLAIRRISPEGGNP